MNLDEALLKVQKLHNEYVNSCKELIPIIKEEILNLFKQVYKEVNYFQSVEHIQLYIENDKIEYIFYCDIEKSIQFVQNGLLNPFKREFNEKYGKEYFLIEMKDVPFRIEDYLTKLHDNYMTYSLLTNNNSPFLISLI